MGIFPSRIIGAEAFIHFNSDIAVIAGDYDFAKHTPPVVELFYVAADGGVHHWLSVSDGSWRHHVLAEPNTSWSAAGGGIAAVSRGGTKYRDEVFWISRGTSPDYSDRGAIISARRPGSQAKWDDPWELTRISGDKVASIGSRVQAAATRVQDAITGVTAQLKVYYVPVGGFRVAEYTSHEKGLFRPREWVPSGYVSAAPKDSWAFKVSSEPDVIGSHSPVDPNLYPKITWADLGGQVHITFDTPGSDDPGTQITNDGEATGSGGIAGEAQINGYLCYNVAWIRPDGSVRGCASNGTAKTRVYDIAPAGESGAAPGARIASLAAPDKLALDHVLYTWVRRDGGIQLAEWAHDVHNTDPSLPHTMTLTQAALAGSSTGSSGLGLVADWPCPGSRMILYRGPDGSLRSSYSIPESRTWSGNYKAASSDDDKSCIQYSTTIHSDGSLSWSGRVTKNNPSRPFFTITISLWPFADTGMGPLIFIASGKADGPGPYPSWDTTTMPKQVVAQNRNDYMVSNFELRFESSDTDPGAINFAHYVREGILSRALACRTAIGDRALTKSCLTPIVGCDARSICTPSFSVLNGVMIGGTYVALAGPNNCVYTVPSNAAVDSLVNSRSLTATEYAWAKDQVFGGTSLPPANRIQVTNLDIPYDDFTFLRYDGTILLHLGKADYADPVKTRPAKLLHHLVHAWQIAHGAATPQVAEKLADALLIDAMPHDFMLDIFPAVKSPPQKWKSFNVEQQARIVEYWWLGKREIHYQFPKPPTYFDNGTGIPKDVKSPYYVYITENIQKGIA